MAYRSDILLGRITKVNGFEGAVTVRLEKTFIENIPQMESVFLETEGRLVPFFIEDSDYSGAEILKLEFEGYSTIEKISEFVGCRVFLTTLISESGENESVHTYVGYDVYTHLDQFLGVISEVISNPGQWLLGVQTESKKELLIPFHEDLIIDIDLKKKSIIMNIPEGLLEIN